MPVVPFSRNESQIDDSLMPSRTHVMMAAATLQEAGHLEEGALSRYPKPGPRRPLHPNLKQQERKMEADQEKFDTDPAIDENAPREVKLQKI